MDFGGMDFSGGTDFTGGMDFTGGGTDFTSGGMDFTGGGMDFTGAGMDFTGGGMDLTGGMGYGDGTDFSAMGYGDGMQLGHDTATYDNMHCGNMGDHAATYNGHDLNATDFLNQDATANANNHGLSEITVANGPVHDGDANNHGLSEITVANGPVHDGNADNNEQQASDNFVAFANGVHNGLQQHNKPNKPHKPNKPDKHNKPPKPNQHNHVHSAHSMPVYTYATVPGVAATTSHAIPVYNTVTGVPQSYMMAVPATAAAVQHTVPVIHPAIVPPTMMSPVAHAGVHSNHGNMQYGLKPQQPVQPVMVAPSLGHHPHKPMTYPTGVGVNTMAAAGNLGSGGCINGMPHRWNKEYTTLGLALAFCLFPCGLICCQNSAYMQCSQCHQTKKE